jgi:hypothetical protein
MSHEIEQPADANGANDAVPEVRAHEENNGDAAGAKLLPNTCDISERDREIFRKVVVEGRLTSDVARDFSLSQRHVQRIVRHCERLAALGQFQHSTQPRWLGVMHVQRLEHQWREAMVAWYRSQHTLETVRYSTERGSDKGKIDRTRREQQGDAKYLAHARRILADIRTLIVGGALGDAAEGLIDVSTLTFDERREELAQLAIELRDREREEKDWGTDPGPAEADGEGDCET